MRVFIALMILSFFQQASFAQQTAKPNVRSELRKGNELYKAGKYKEAQSAYLGALQKDPTSFTGIFNMGDALYNDKQYEQARQALNAGLKTTKDKKEQARAYHNIGNTFLQEKKWEDAVGAFKQSLRLDPTDADTKYNLAYASAMLKKEGGGKDNKDNKDKKDQDKKDQDQDKKDQEKKDQDKKDQDKKDGDKKDENKDNGDKEDKGKQDKGDKEEQPKGQPQPSKLSQQQAENLLNALRQEEKKLQDKKEKDKGTPVKMEKDW